jgi:competence protein ComEA
MRKFFIVGSILFLLFSMCGPLAASEDGKININTAGKEELTKLDNIGPSKAENIIKFREGTPFKSIEDIIQVKGIGQKTFEKIKDRITVGGASEKE